MISFGRFVSTLLDLGKNMILLTLLQSEVPSLMMRGAQSDHGRATHDPNMDKQNGNCEYDNTNS